MTAALSIAHILVLFMRRAPGQLHNPESGRSDRATSQPDLSRGTLAAKPARNYSPSPLRRAQGRVPAGTSRFPEAGWR